MTASASHRCSIRRNNIFDTLCKLGIEYLLVISSKAILTRNRRHWSTLVSHRLNSLIYVNNRVHNVRHWLRGIRLWTPSWHTLAYSLSLKAILSSLRNRKMMNSCSFCPLYVMQRAGAATMSTRTVAERCDLCLQLAYH